MQLHEELRHQLGQPERSMSCQALHDWITQEDHTGYQWSECAQCGAAEYLEPDTNTDEDSEDE